MTVIKIPPYLHHLGGIEGKYLNVSYHYFIFTDISHAEKGSIGIRHIKRNWRPGFGLLGGLWGWGGGKNSIFFQNMVMLHIKLKGIAHAAIWYMVANVLPVEFPHPNPRGMLKKGQNSTLLKIVRIHIKLKGMEHRAPCKHIFCSHTHLRLLRWGQISESSHVAYQINGNVNGA